MIKESNAMKTFVRRIGSKILGILNGFDRIRLRGTRRFSATVGGMLGYLWVARQTSTEQLTRAA